MLYVITYMWNIKNEKHIVDLVCFLLSQFLLCYIYFSFFIFHM